MSWAAPGESPSLRERAAQLKARRESARATRAADPAGTAGAAPCDVCDALGAALPHALPLPLPLPAAPASAAEAAAPGIAEIGQGTWTLLHTVAAYYPRAAAPAEQAQARALLGAVAALFPCRVCADDFAAFMAQRPPRVEGRHAFSQWLCDAHNDVNAKLGKALFDCTRVLERWRKPGLADE